jgi:DNA-binding transcriptional MerR regulator
MTANCAGLHRRRQAAETTLKALRIIVEKRSQLTVKQPGLQVCEAARLVGVRASAVRYWEERGLLHPRRDTSSKYRLYDEEQLLRLRIVALLRDVEYDFDVIQAVLAEVAVGNIEQAVRAAERRLQDLLEESQRCSATTAAVWNYIQEIREET